MTKEQKLQIARLRRDGYGYVKIAQILGISDNTVKSYCRRNHLTGKAVKEKSQVRISSDEGLQLCMSCGVSVKQIPGRKQKKFCSDKCRMKWWNSHLDKVKRKAVYEFICPTCGKRFTAYGNSHRKYCSHECYVVNRFGGGQNE